MLGVEEVVVVVGEDQAKRNMGSTLEMQLQHQREKTVTPKHALQLKISVAEEGNINLL